MADVPHSRLCGDVAKLAAAQVFEQPVAVAHGGDEQIGIPIVVDVGERAADGDGVRHAEAGRVGDIGESAVAQVLPQLAGA